MRRQPERVAWIILLSAFFTFCVLIISVPLGIRWYILHAETEHDAFVESLIGTVVVVPPVGGGPIPLGKGRRVAVSEGTLIRVDETSEAVVTFFDHSFMRLFSGTTVRVDRLRSPQYSSSPLPSTIHLGLTGGVVRIGTALSLDSPLEFGVTTPHAQTTLSADGSYSVAVLDDRSEITSYRGYATVHGAGEEIELGARQRTEVMYDRPPEPPTGVAKNLIVNGDFAEGLSEGWRVFSDQGTDGGEIDGKVEMVVDEGRRAARISRVGGQGNHCETIIEQTLDQQLPDPLTSLVLRATVKVRYQSLSGGGYLSSEYPLMVRLTYRDVYDSEAEWVQGFYYQNTAGNPTMYGEQIPQERWHLFESVNLLQELPIRPYRVIRIRIYGSGWDYDSLLSEVSLIVE